ncbi:MAG: DUF2085 domain-containing protein [Chloroflexi bacterium]|nr:DUF2085 domain-containing protein [Chloroflexota bacterium]
MTTQQPTNLTMKADKFSYFFSKHWLAVFNTVVAIYIFLPMLAPVMMKVGLTGPARVVYTIYSPMCHQMASRSFFLFGEQSAYPRELAGTELQPLEAYINDIPEFEGVNPQNWANFFLAARRFVGNEQLGYKMALCERDIAIYSFVLIFGLLYAALRNRFNIRPLPVYIFIIVGMGPIALDGFSQLFGYYATPLDGSAPQGFQQTIGAIFALRESPPFLRFFTGALFGFMLGWLIYPHIGAGMKVSEQEAKLKLDRVGNQ